MKYIEPHTTLLYNGGNLLADHGSLCLYQEEVNQKLCLHRVMLEDGNSYTVTDNELSFIENEFGDNVFGDTKDKPDAALTKYARMTREDRRRLIKDSLEAAVRDLMQRCMELLHGRGNGHCVHLLNYSLRKGHQWNFERYLRRELFGDAPYTNFNPPKLYFGHKQVLKIHGHYWINSQSHLLELLSIKPGVLEANKQLLEDMKGQTHQWIEEPKGRSEKIMADWWAREEARTMPNELSP